MLRDLGGTVPPYGLNILDVVSLANGSQPAEGVQPMGCRRLPFGYILFVNIKNKRFHTNVCRLLPVGGNEDMLEGRPCRLII